MARVNILTMGEKNIREDDLQNVHSTNKVENQFYGWRMSASGSGFWFVRNHLVFIVPLCPRTLSSKLRISAIWITDFVSNPPRVSDKYFVFQLS